jgi:cell division protein FtsL
MLKGGSTMTGTASNRRYGQGAVYGSMAYDFSNPAVYPEVTYGKPLDTPAAPEVKEEVVTKEAARVRQSIAPLSVVGFACAAVLLVFTLMAQIQLTTASNEAARLETTLRDLKTEQAKLLINYESAFNLAEIEDYATNELGMQKPTSDQIYYINGGASDKASILSGETDEYTLADRLGDFLSGLGEYFRQ